MNRYIIERNVPGAGRLSAEELQSIARKSVEVLDVDGRRDPVERELRHRGQRCSASYLADGEDAIREHGRRGGFPVDGIYRGDRCRSTRRRRPPTVGVMSAGASADRGRRPRRARRCAGDQR